MNLEARSETSQKTNLKTALRAQDTEHMTQNTHQRRATNNVYSNKDHQFQCIWAQGHKQERKNDYHDYSVVTHGR